jgi:heme-degrading monooxygenase HmoA
MVEALKPTEQPPKGSRARLAGPTQAGWHIVSLWGSREDFEAFVRDRLTPALQRAGRPLPDFQFRPMERAKLY